MLSSQKNPVIFIRFGMVENITIFVKGFDEFGLSNFVFNDVIGHYPSGIFSIGHENFIAAIAVVLKNRCNDVCL